MKWVVFCSALTVALVDLPLVYSILFVHGPRVTARLWGYAPQQYVFNTWVFPFATFATFTVYYILIRNIAGKLTIGSSVKWCLDNWLVIVFLVFIFSSITSIAVYFSSTLSIDKLKPDYAIEALNSLDSLKIKIDGMSGPDAEAYLRVQRTKSNDEIGFLLQNSTGSIDVPTYLHSVSDIGKLRILQHPYLQRQLSLLDPIAQAMSMFQLFINLVIGLLCLVAILVTALVACDMGYLNGQPSMVKIVITALIFAVTAFAIFSICYSQFRHQLEYLIGDRLSVLPDIFVMLLATSALIILQFIDPSNRLLSGVSAVKFAPALLVGAGSILATQNMVFMRQLIGDETKFGIQVILALIIIIAGSAMTFIIFPRE